MGCACCTYGGEGEVHMEFLCEKRSGIDHWEDLGVDGSILLNWIVKKLNCGA